MRKYEKYKGLVKLLFCLIQVMMLVAPYSALWIGYYNKVIPYPFFRRGKLGNGLFVCCCINLLYETVWRI